MNQEKWGQIKNAYLKQYPELREALEGLDRNVRGPERDSVILNKVERALNVIFHGPPGTGKTYKALRFLKPLGDEHICFITFHQSYSYEDFVEGLRPVSDADGNVRYEVKDGVFKRVCRRAQQDPSHTYALVIDEINR
ncbi:MAG: AAA family ATPase, partial [Verrucomicrobiae bacterium]|nr:AAA family ATPase [Verrucomicrobiae bacterium]